MRILNLVIISHWVGRLFCRQDKYVLRCEILEFTKSNGLLFQSALSRLIVDTRIV